MKTDEEKIAQTMTSILGLPALPEWSGDQWADWILSLLPRKKTQKKLFSLYENLDQNEHWRMKTDFVQGLFIATERLMGQLANNAPLNYERRCRLLYLLSLLAQVDYIHVDSNDWMLKVRNWYTIACRPEFIRYLKTRTFPAFVEWGTPPLRDIETALDCPSIAPYAYAALVNYARHNMRQDLKDTDTVYMVRVIKQMVALGYHAVIGKCFDAHREWWAETSDDGEHDGWLTRITDFLTPHELDIARGQALLQGVAIGRKHDYGGAVLTPQTICLNPDFLAAFKKSIALAGCLICGRKLVVLEGYFRAQVPPEPDHMLHQKELYRCPNCPIAWAAIQSYEDLESDQDRLWVQAYDLVGPGGALLHENLYLGDKGRTRRRRAEPLPTGI